MVFFLDPSRKVAGAAPEVGDPKSVPPESLAACLVERAGRVNDRMTGATSAAGCRMSILRASRACRRPGSESPIPAVANRPIRSVRRLVSERRERKPGGGAEVRQFRGGLVQGASWPRFSGKGAA